MTTQFCCRSLGTFFQTDRLSYVGDTWCASNTPSTSRLIIRQRISSAHVVPLHRNSPPTAATRPWRACSAPDCARVARPTRSPARCPPGGASSMRAPPCWRRGGGDRTRRTGSRCCGEPSSPPQPQQQPLLARPPSCAEDGDRDGVSLWVTRRDSIRRCQMVVGIRRYKRSQTIITN